MRPGDNDYYGRDDQLDNSGTAPMSQKPITESGQTAAGAGYVTAPKSLLHFNRWAVIGASLVTLAILVIGLVALGVLGFESNDQDGIASKQPANNYEDNTVVLDDVKANQILTISKASTLNINGELQVGNTFILTPTATPTTPKIGQMYYNQETNTPYIYNGAEFINMADRQFVRSIGGSTGSIGVGTGIQFSNDQLSIAPNILESLAVRVTTVQGQSGDIVFRGGTGIGVNGTTINNTGVLAVVGTSGLTTVQNNGTVTVSLPQLLGTTNTPTFAGMQLSSALGAAYGGTGLGVSSLVGNSLLITNADGTAYELVTGTTGGQCLVTDNLDNAKIKFGSCGGSIASGVNGITDGSGNSVDGDVIMRPGTNSPLTVVANATTNVIELGLSLTTNRGLTATTNGGVTSLGLQTCSVNNQVLKFSTALNGWVCDTDSEGTDTNTTYSAGNGIGINGSNVISVVLRPLNSGLRFNNEGQLTLASCNTDEILKASGNGAWLCAADVDTDTDTDTTYSNGNGITIDGNNAISALLQTSNGGLRFNTNGELTLTSCTVDQVLKSNGTGGWVCGSDSEGTDTNTTYSAGSGIDISGANVVSVALQGTAGAGSGLKVDNTGLALQSCSTDEHVLKYDIATGWYCAPDSEGSGDGQGITLVASDSDALTVSTPDSATARLDLVLQSGRGLTTTVNGLGLQTCSVNNQVLKYNTGTDSWYCAADTDTDTNTTYTNGDGITINPLALNAISVLLQVSNSGLRFNANGELTLASCTVDQVLKSNGTGGWVCGSDTVGGGDGNTTYAQGDGIYIDALDSNRISVALQGTAGAGSGLKVDNTGLALQSCSTEDYLLKYSTANGWYCTPDIDTDTNTTYSAGSGIGINGSNVISVVLRPLNSGLRFNANGELLLADCTADQILKAVGNGAWICGGDNVGSGDGQGIATLGALDGGTADARGASLSVDGGTIYLQSASGTAAGLVNISAQSFAGVKTFTDGLTVGTTLITTDVTNSKVGINGAINASDDAALQVVNGNFSMGSGRIYTSQSGINVRYNSNLNDQNILYGGTSAEGVILQNVRLANNSTIKFGDDTAGALYADANGFVKKLSTASATGKCYSFDGTSFVWSDCGVTVASGSGSTNVISKFNASGQLIDSSLSDDGATLTYTGNLTVAGTINGLTASASALSSAAALSITGGTTLSLQSTGTSAVVLDSGTTGAVNIGTGASAKTITIGNTTTSTGLVLQAGTSGISLTGNTIITGTLRATSNLIANTGLYTGASSGTLRINASGALSNVSIPTASTVTVGTAAAVGVLYVNSSNVLQFANVNGTYASTTKCLMSNGSTSLGFGTCPGGGGSGGWSLTGDSAAGSILGSNAVTSADFVISSRPNNVGATSSSASYISFSGDQYSNANRIVISGNSNSNAPQGGGAWSSSNNKDYFRIQDSAGGVAFAVQGNGGQQQVFMYLSAGSSVGVQGRVCSTLSAGGSGMATLATCTSTGTDLAEAYNSTQALEPGDIVATDPNNYPNVLRSDHAGQDNLIGIVSTEPDDTLGIGKTPNGYPIALVGRVPTKVNGEGGAIQPGDKITSSSVPGVGKKATGAGMIVGTALTGFDGNGQGVIEVFVHTSYYSPSNTDTLQAQTAVLGDLNVSGTATIDNLAVTTLHVSGDLTVSGLATVHNIVINGHIITAGDTPTTEALAAAGTQAVVAIDGNDTAGTITITTGSNGLAAGALASVTFNAPYDKAPRIIVSGQDDASAQADMYPAAKTATGFELRTPVALQPNTTYTLDYFISQ